jgi:hypothetical protein
MRGLSILESEGDDFEGVSMMNSETFAQKRLFVIIFCPIGIVPVGTRKLQEDRGTGLPRNVELFEAVLRFGMG